MPEPRRPRNVLFLWTDQQRPDTIGAYSNLILHDGPVTMCIGEFHKNMLNAKGPSLGVSTLLNDLIHAVGFVRYLCGGEAPIGGTATAVSSGSMPARSGS